MLITSLFLFLFLSRPREKEGKNRSSGAILEVFLPFFLLRLLELARCLKTEVGLSTQKMLEANATFFSNSYVYKWTISKEFF